MHLHYHQVLGLFSLLVLLPSFISAISYCGGPCNNMNDCNGQLTCIGGECKDDPDIGTHICGSSGGGGTPSPSGGTCRPSGEASCNSQSKPTYTCSPPITYPSTRATLTNNDFSKGGDGGGASECDNSYHSNSERVVALSTGWYANGNRCGKMIRITASNGNISIAKVVDECDSRNGGCDADHSFQGPCGNNIVDASNAVWQDLGLNTDIGVVDITWSMA